MPYAPHGTNFLSLICQERSTNDRTSDRMYECEVKKQFVRDGAKRWEWVKVAVLDAIKDGATD